MSGDDVIDVPSEFLPEAVRREMLRRQREGDGKVDVPPMEEPEAESLPSLESLSPLPGPGDPYTAHSRPASRGVLTLWLLTGDGRRWAMPYAARVEGPHLIPGEAGQGDTVVLRFNLSVLAEVTLYGHALDQLPDYLGDHRIRWIREVPKGRLVKGGGMPVITRIKVERVDSWPPLGLR